jgi:hypothetical protein
MLRTVFILVVVKGDKRKGADNNGVVLGRACYHLRAMVKTTSMLQVKTRIKQLSRQNKRATK